jgi:hypothetical protein
MLVYAWVSWLGLIPNCRSSVYPAGGAHFMIHGAEGISPQEFKKQLRWFAKDVMPAFR